LAGRPDRLLLRGLVASELGARVLSAVVLATAALLAAVLGGWPFALFWLVAGLAVAAEWTAVTRTEPSGPIRATTCVGLIILAVATFLDAGATWALLGWLGGSALILALGAGRHDRLWAAAGFAAAAVIVVVPPSMRGHPELGLAGLLWMFAVVWTTDIAAYFTGRRLGGPKLWPRVSPKKTWSGFGGGLVAGTLAGLLTASVATRLGWSPVASPALVALLSAVASVVSQLGDLGESALKRQFDVKDSGRLIPGHGGVMDRIDGFWAVSLLVGLLLALRSLWT
jgi:phosphatidate cytidylyltransferase